MLLLSQRLARAGGFEHFEYRRAGLYGVVAPINQADVICAVHHNRFIVRRKRGLLCKQLLPFCDSAITLTT
jgi:hypothetical protein